VRLKVLMALSLEGDPCAFARQGSALRFFDSTYVSAQVKLG
jgi:hypothetical protein